jgi:NAD(P)H-dependent FMN reductase
MAIEIVTMSGSVRQNNYTDKALTLVMDELKQRPGVVVHQIDLGSIDFPLPGRPLTDPKVKEFQQVVRNATGVVIATPEYHGSFSSLIKLAIENLGFPNGLKGKPVALLGVAAGQIGAIKSLEHLRSVCSHVGAIVLPSLISLDRVKERLDLDGTPLDEESEEKLRGVAHSLVNYIEEAVCPKFVLEEMMRSEA